MFLEHPVGPQPGIWELRTINRPSPDILPAQLHCCPNTQTVLLTSGERSCASFLSLDSSSAGSAPANQPSPNRCRNVLKEHFYLIIHGTVLFHDNAIPIRLPLLCFFYDINMEKESRISVTAGVKSLKSELSVTRQRAAQLQPARFLSAQNVAVKH